MRRLTCAILGSALALTACSGQTPERGEDEREAEGEVLGGTISDAMLPLDQLQSQLPAIREAPAAAPSEEEGETADSDDAAEAPPAAPQAPAEPAAPQE